MKSLFFTLLLLFNVTLYAQDTITPEDLYTVTYYTIGETAVNEENSEIIKQYLKIELIDESVFHAKQATAVNFLKKDSAIKKIKGTITLPCIKKKVVFTDRDPEDETRREYEYIGQIAVLNQYVIYGEYWEDLDYTLIDKTTGNETALFMDFPYLSADKKYIADVYANPYDTAADFGLDYIDKGTIKNLLLCGFKNWMPAGSDTEPFWATDGYFYIPINLSDNYWDEKGEINKERLYIRIKILDALKELKQ